MKGRSAQTTPSSTKSLVDDGNEEEVATRHRWAERRAWLMTKFHGKGSQSDEEGAPELDANHGHSPDAAEPGVEDMDDARSIVADDDDAATDQAAAKIGALAPMAFVSCPELARRMGVERTRSVSSSRLCGPLQGHLTDASSRDLFASWGDHT